MQLNTWAVGLSVVLATTGAMGMSVQNQPTTPEEVATPSQASPAEGSSSDGVAPPQDAEGGDQVENAEGEDQVENAEGGNPAGASEEGSTDAPQDSMGTGTDDAPAGEPMPDSGLDGGVPYRVDSIAVEYAAAYEGVPTPDAFRDATFDLLRTADGFVASREGVSSEAFTIDDLASGGDVVLWGSAIKAIGAALAKVVVESGTVGVYVVPASDQIATSGADLREGDTSLTFVVHVGHVGEVRSIASGERIAFENRMNATAHRRIRENSPIGPGEGQNALIRANDLERYVLRLNRHPGRRVDVAIGPGDEQDEAVLDYLVTENRIFRLYAQVSNTGTKQTNEWRERFGASITQLTGHDDILNLEYATAGFDESHALIASYSAPVLASDWLRFEVGGSWSEYTASDVGASNQVFEGDGIQASFDLVANVLQVEDFFLDVFGGVRYANTRVNNVGNPDDTGEGEQDFLIPRIGVRAERRREASIFTASVSYEFSLPDATNVDQQELQELGRLRPDDQWDVLRWNAGYSFYLDPLFEGGYTRGKTSLVHEMAFSFRGQYAMNDRLIPTEEQVAGGLYSVRGYRESATAADTVLLGTAEYRFHLPRAFSPTENDTTLFGERFRYAPASPGGRPDWDLIARAFVDWGKTTNSRIEESFEFDEDLLGAGLGLEFVFRQNLSLRVDWGVALSDTKLPEIDSGSSRIHFVGTILY